MAPALAVILPEERSAQREDHGALGLGDDGVPVDEGPAVESDVHLLDLGGSARVHRDLGHHRDVAQEAAVGGDPEAAALGKLAAPAGALGRQLDDAAEPPRVHGVVLQLAAVVRVVGPVGLEVHVAGRADQLQQVVLGVGARRVGQLVSERADGESVVDVRHRAQPADADVRCDGGVLQAQVGHVEGQVGEAQPQLPVRRVLRLSVEGGRDRGKDGAVSPGDRGARGVEAGLEVLGAHGVVEAVLDLVFPRPGHLDRLPDLLREQRGLEDEVGLRLAAEAAAQERHVHRDLLHREAQGRGHLFPGPHRILRAGPDLAAPVPHRSQRGRRLDGAVGEVGRVVERRHPLGRGAEGGVHVAPLAHHLGRLAGLRLQLLPVRDRVVAGLGSGIPRHLQRLAALERRPGVIRDHGQAAQRLHPLGKTRRLQLHDVPHSRHPERGLAVEAGGLAAHGRGALDGRVQHPRDAGVDAELRPARDDVGHVHQLPALADVAPLRPGLELQRRRVGGGQRRGPLRQLAVAEAPAAGPVVDEVLGRLALLDRDAPALRRRREQQLAGGGSDLAHRLEEVADAVGAVGVLVAVALVGQGLDHAHAVEVGVHLVGHDHGQRGPDALAHLGAVGHDLHLPRSLERHEQVETERLGVGGRRRRALGAQAEDQRPRPQTGQLQELAPTHELHPPGLARAIRPRHPRRHSAAALRTASRIRRYVPQRQRLPASAESISWSVGLGFSRRSAAAVMIWPTWQ